MENSRVKVFRPAVSVADRGDGRACFMQKNALLED